MKEDRKSFPLSRRKFVWSAAAGTLIAGAARPWRSVQAAGSQSLSYVVFGDRASVWAKPYFFLSEEVEERSDGDLKINYAGGSEVVGGFDAPEAVANGVFDMSHSANSYFAGAMPSAISLATGAASVESLREVGALDAFDEILQRRVGVKLLGVPMSRVGYVFMTKQPPETLAYYQGKRIRSIPLYDPILQELQATPVTTDPAEAYSALERGVVDGLGWPDIGLLDYNFHEQAPYLMLPEFYTLRTTTLINPNSFDGLPQALQEVLVESAEAADIRGAEWCEETSAAERAQMMEDGLQIVELPPDDAEEFVSLTEEKLWEKILEQSPDDGAKLQSAFSKAAA